MATIAASGGALSRYDRLRAKGMCTRCRRVPSTHPLCDECVVREGVVDFRYPVKYEPIDQAMERPRVRLLLALVWFEWIDVTGLFLAAHLPLDIDSREYRTAMQNLGRLVKYGLAERRLLNGKTVNGDYRITPAGRAEVARYRAGDFSR